MSGLPRTALNISSDATELRTLAVAEKLGCSGSDEEQLQCLRAVPMEEILDVVKDYSTRNHPPLGLFTFIPSVDGDLYTDRQSELYRRGRFIKGKSFQHTGNLYLLLNSLGIPLIYR
jgi:carboxylesterase type B